MTNKFLAPERTANNFCRQLSRFALRLTYILTYSALANLCNKNTLIPVQIPTARHIEIMAEGNARLAKLGVEGTLVYDRTFSLLDGMTASKQHAALVEAGWRAKTDPTSPTDADRLDSPILKGLSLYFAEVERRQLAAAQINWGMARQIRSELISADNPPWLNTLYEKWILNLQGDAKECLKWAAGAREKRSAEKLVYLLEEQVNGASYRKLMLGTHQVLHVPADGLGVIDPDELRESDENFRRVIDAANNFEKQDHPAFVALRSIENAHGAAQWSMGEFMRGPRELRDQRQNPFKADVQRLHEIGNDGFRDFTRADVLGRMQACVEHEATYLEFFADKLESWIAANDKFASADPRLAALVAGQNANLKIQHQHALLLLQQTRARKDAMPALLREWEEHPDAIPDANPLPLFIGEAGVESLSLPGGAK